jgi:hypothetical protein
MDRKYQVAKDLSRNDHIKEEARRALEFGQTPKRPVSVDAKFRVEGLVATTPPSPEPPGARFLDNARMEILTSRSDIPAVLQSNDSAEVLASLIESQLQRIAPDDTDDRAGAVLDNLARLQHADPRSTTATLRRKVFSALFGDAYAKSEQNLTSDSTAAVGGRAANSEGRN